MNKQLRELLAKWRGTMDTFKADAQEYNTLFHIHKDAKYSRLADRSEALAKLQENCIIEVETIMNNKTHEE